MPFFKKSPVFTSDKSIDLNIRMMKLENNKYYQNPDVSFDGSTKEVIFNPS